MEPAAREWAQEEFGGADLGDSRRTDRLVRLAAQVASCPAGTVTKVVSRSAEREGAFRLLENRNVSVEALARASHEAAVARAREFPFVYVPVDGSSLSLTDRARKRAVGPVGTLGQHGRGLITQTALCVSPDGTPLGVCGQLYWARKSKRSKKREPHHSKQTEMGHVVRLLTEVHDRFEQQAPEVHPWYQLDRGYDAWLVLQLAKERNLRLTVRATHNRRVREHSKAPVRYLNDLIRKAKIIGYHTVEVPAKDGRPGRSARLAVRAFSATFELPVGRKRREYARLNVVVATEVGRRDGLCWKLLTTAPVDSLEDAIAVLQGYETRWRIEDAQTQTIKRSRASLWNAAYSSSFVEWGVAA